MKSSSRFVAGLTLASLLFAAPASAQDEDSMAVGNATVSVGAGTALLTLPDVPSFLTFDNNVLTFPLIRGFKFSDDFDDETGWNVNGSVEVPIAAGKTIAVNGFWANIDDKGSALCTRDTTGTNRCTVYPLVDDPGVAQAIFTLGGNQSIGFDASRDVDFWGVSVEAKRQLDPGISGVTRAPNRRYVALGADIRGIDQDLDVGFTLTNTPLVITTINYTEELDTRYYGAFAAWGGEYSPFLLKGLWERMGLRSSFRLQGGVYYADTDYEGRLAHAPTLIGAFNVNNALSLSENKAAFIGRLVTETTKRIGRRAALSLKSEYEYYSYVPEMAYNTVDLAAAGGVPFSSGRQAGTVINDDDAFSARASLRLTIKLGPDSIMNAVK